MHVRKLAPHEIALHREIRLRALSEASEFLGSTFAETASQPDYYWEQLTHSVTEPNGDVMFLAIEDKLVVGSVYGLLNPEKKNDIGHVRGMWVEPVWRSQGIGRALLQEVFSWAREIGLNYLDLWVPTHSEAASALYIKAGFRKTGNLAPLPNDAFLQITEMGVQL